MSETNLFGQAEVNLDLGLVEIGNYRSGRNSISSSTITLRMEIMVISQPQMNRK